MKDRPTIPGPGLFPVGYAVARDECPHCGRPLEPSEDSPTLRCPTHGPIKNLD